MLLNLPFHYYPGFEPIISPEVFEEVQKKRRNAVWLLTNEEVLERVRAFAEANGAVRHDTLTRGKGVPCYDTLIRRFGNMRQVYDLIGMQFTRVFHLRGGQQKSRILRMKAGMEFEDSLRAAEIPFRRDGFIFTLNACHPLHLQLAWCIGRTHRGDLRWKIHWSRNAHNQPCLAARLTFDNAKILDWFLLMNAPHSQTNFRLSEQAIRGTQSARPSATAELVDHFEAPCAVWVWRKLEDCATLLGRVGAAIDGVARCAVEVADRVGDEADPRAARGIVHELVNHAVGSGAVRVRGQLENRATPISAAVCGSTVKITCRIKEWGGSGLGSIFSTSELMQYTFGPGAVRVRGQLEDRALSILASKYCDPVEIPGNVEGQPAPVNIAPVIAASEAIKYGLLPSSVAIRAQTVDGARSVDTAVKCCAIKVASLTED